MPNLKFTPPPQKEPLKSPPKLGLTNRVLENKLQSGIIKTDISDHFPIFTVFTVLKTNKTCFLEKTKFIKHDISSGNIDTKFQLENIKWDKILPDNSPDKAYDKVTPIFKSGKNKLLTNYRPISVLLCFSKILERIMYKRLSEYLTKNYLLFDKQLNLERVI